MYRIALLVGVLGCSHEQTNKEAWQLICASQARFANVDPAQRATKHAEYLTANVTNAEAKQQLSSLATTRDRAEVIELMLDEAGVPRASCEAMLRTTREQEAASERARATPP